MIIGIDIGLDGAVAFFDGPHLEVRDMPTLALIRNGKNRRAIDAHVLADWIEAAEPIHVFVEEAWARPGEAASVSYVNGRNHGIVLGILAALNIPMTSVSPQRWKKALGVPAVKDGARARASELLPQHAAHWPLKRDHGKAESALIGLFGLQGIQA